MSWKETLSLKINFNEMNEVEYERRKEHVKIARHVRTLCLILAIVSVVIGICFYAWFDGLANDFEDLAKDWTAMGDETHADECWAQAKECRQNGINDLGEYSIISLFLFGMGWLLGVVAKDQDIQLEGWYKQHLQPLVQSQMTSQQSLSQPSTEQKPNTRYCSSCGNKIQPDWQICGYCGKKIKGVKI